MGSGENLIGLCMQRELIVESSVFTVYDGVDREALQTVHVELILSGRKCVNIASEF